MPLKRSLGKRVILRSRPQEEGDTDIPGNLPGNSVPTVKASVRDFLDVMVLRGQTNSNEDEEAIRVCGCRPDLDHKEHRTYVLNSVGQETVLCSPGAVEMRSDFKIISGIEECDRCR